MNLPFTKAVFEAVSGITTTGSTVMSGLDDTAPTILFWRAFLLWIGGVGIIGLSIAILPYLCVGGMQLFRLQLNPKRSRSPGRGPRLGGRVIPAAASKPHACARPRF